jgi:hypothetical protein
MRLEYLQRRCRSLGLQNLEPMFLEKSGGKKPQKLFVVDHKCQWMRCFAHHP